jgi:hypothetical protein
MKKCLTSMLPFPLERVCLSHDESGESCCKADAAVPRGRSEITGALSSSKTVPEESVSLP